MSDQLQRIGLIIPSSNTVAERELPRGLPPSVTMHVTRCLMPEVDDVDQKLSLFEATEDGGRLMEAAHELATVHPHLIVWACTVGSFIKGGRHDLTLGKGLEEATGIPALTTTTALIWAIEALGLGTGRLGLVTPYHPKIARMEQEYLEAALPGLEVVARADLGIVRGKSKGDLNPQTVVDAAHSIDKTKIDGLLVSCTNWQTFDVIGSLEQAFGVPVITSNQATLWAVYEMLGIQGPHPGGRLFAVRRSKS